MPAANVKTAAAKKGTELRRLPVSSLIIKQRDIRNLYGSGPFRPNDYFSTRSHLPRSNGRRMPESELSVRRANSSTAELILRLDHPERGRQASGPSTSHDFNVKQLL